MYSNSCYLKWAINPHKSNLERMKKISITLFLALSVCFVRAQRFFYLESDNSVSDFLKYDLLKSAQFITKTPIASDYIVKMKASLQTESNRLSLNIRLQDSITLETIYQTNEEYSYGEADKYSKIFLKTTIRSFIDRNIGQIIIYAKDDHYDSRMKFLKPKKDKT